ncbi:ABC transporter substrate-binding protein [Actinoplanes ianthinogenes]|uniref:ABC transporter substrate-binding protein n=1 Tax=Actinoplanes ianthinogenes TaxID=122358 RepID=A0ABM7LLV7_9ACTN|nr:ABC transporter substrate-binding protein [Actinoplanes ianthinogenes]BCJ40281.1 ABC transporter substrate-binding protein [Actinoplanes ianthinogenes]GGR11341.1 ABC transporter substrate-binding protein [Actinoplanes ianthinogenes]
MSYSSLSLSRRGLLAAGGAAALGTVLSACGSKKEETGTAAGASAAAGPWTFTDDQPKPLTSAKTPSKIVAFTGTAAALADLGLQDKIVGVFGETKKADGTAEEQAGDLDISKVQIVGNAWGEFSVEKYAALTPDLLVTHMYDQGAWWYVPDESKDKILAVAPSNALIGVGRVPLNKPIERYAELAKSLGADLNAPKVTEAKARFEKAAADLSAAAKASGGIKVLFGSGAADIFYVSSAAVSSDLMYFKELGVDLIMPEVKGADYYESLSWENADKYKADIIFLDARTGTLQPKDLASKPSWNALPAVKANQVFPWQAVPIFSWNHAAPLIEAITAAITKSKKVA